MDLACEQLFADATFPRNQYFGVALGCAVRKRHGRCNLRADDNNPGKLRIRSAH
jgi:hypothetical protein